MLSSLRRQRAAGRQRSALPVSSVDDFEPYEGMLVTFPQDAGHLGVLQLRPLWRDRADVRSAPHADGRVRAGLAEADRRPPRPILLNRITLDDGRTSQNPDPGHPSERRRVRPRQPVPRRRHGRQRDRRDGLRLRPVPDPADAGRRLHARQSADQLRPTTSAAA